MLFVIIHLAGNLTLFAGPEPFNAYAHFLKTFLHGSFIYFAEAGLLLFFGVHIVSGIQVALLKFKARPVPYRVSANAGGPSQKSAASVGMIISGLALLVFVVLHVAHFKYGPAEDAGYITQAHGTPMRDVYRLVIEEFNKPIPAFGYAFFMLGLGLHLRHGFWSAFQSLGFGSRRLTPILQGVGVVVAILLAIGFVGLPLYIYFAVPPSPPALLAPLGGIP
jgi:succinate dehydrogenase / fumarate reductase cytochrome b subunit